MQYRINKLQLLNLVFVCAVLLLYQKVGLTQNTTKIYLDQNDQPISKAEFNNQIYLELGIEGFKSGVDGHVHKVLPFVEIGKLDSIKLDEIYNAMSNFVSVNRNQVSFVELFSWDGDYPMSELEKKEIGEYLDSVNNIIKRLGNVNQFNVYTRSTGIYVYDDLTTVYRDISNTFEKYIFRYQYNHPAYMVLEPSGEYTIVRKYVNPEIIEYQLDIAQERHEMNSNLNNIFLDEDLNEIKRDSFINKINPQDQIALKIIHGDNRLYRIVSKRYQGQLNPEELNAILKNLEKIEPPKEGLPIIVHFQPNKYAGQVFQNIYPVSDIKRYKRILLKKGGATEYYIGAPGHFYSSGEIIEVHGDRYKRVSNILFPDYQKEMNYAIIFPGGKFRRHYGRYSHEQVVMDFLEMRIASRNP